jgi:RecB family exonuclease
MNDLPKSVDTVVIPEWFSPSQLSMARDCTLRAVLSAGSPSIPRLPSSPTAERGSVFHELLERAGKGTIERLSDPRKAIERALTSALKRAEQRLAAKPETAHFARLQNAFSSLDWHNGCQRVIDLALRLLEQAPPHAPAAPSAFPADRLEFSRLGPTGTWFEVHIDAPLLRLSGRMDVVEKTPEKIVVRDYKTGQAHDREGNVLPHIEQQLRLYALAILEHLPQAAIELWISERRETRILLDNDAVSETRTWLEALLAALRALAEVPAARLANPGPGCLYCPFRHVCPAYLELAPSLWVSGTRDAPLPPDIWGEVVSISRGAMDTSIELKDAAGRRVKVQRLSTRHPAIIALAPGSRIFLFGLSSSMSSPTKGTYFHPRNFFELPVDTSQRRAWSLSIFAGSCHGGATSGDLGF